MHTEDPPTNIQLADQTIRRMLQEYEGPGAPLTRPSPQKKYVRLAIVLGAVCIVAVGLGVGLRGQKDSEEGIRRIEAGTARGVPIPVPVPELIKRADLIFVGTVGSIEGPVQDLPANPPDRPDPLLVYRLSVEVDRLLRGEAGKQVIIVDPEERGGAAYSAEVREQYLFFVSEHALGERGNIEPYPVGLGQGVFQVVDGGRAVNDLGVTVDINAIADNLGP